MAELLGADPPAPHRLAGAASLLEDLEGGNDLERAAAYALLSRPLATRRAYNADWRAFRAWCNAHKLTALPATPQTIVAYMDEHAGVLVVSTLKRRLAAISQIHQAAGQPSPTLTFEVRLVWQAVRNAHGQRPVRQVHPAVTPILRALVGTCDSSLLGLRDRALLLVGFAGFLGRSELIDLDLDDVTEVPEGIDLLLRRPRPDRPAGTVQPIPRGEHEATDPVRALRAWVAAAALTDGPLFRSVDRHGRVGGGRLVGSTVARVVKRAAEAGGLDPAAFSGHSLRAGLADAAFAAGVPAEIILQQGRWTTIDALRIHLQRGTKPRWDYVAAAQVGL